MKVVILCGGKGTRSYPFTEYYPKVMMPVCGTPILIHLMRLYADQGVTDFILAAGHRQEMLRDYFDGRFSNWNVDIVDTGAAADTGERLLQCAPLAGETFFATYGDGLGDVNIRSLLAFHKASGGAATVTSVPLRSQYGTVVFGSDRKVTHFDEKPVIANSWINAGFFVFERRALVNCTGGNLERDVLPNLAEAGELYTYLHKGFWKSMDTSKDQQELEELYNDGCPPWKLPATSAAVA
ncbi:MAG: sugar phosphate nucleotidyltransferase [Terriglobia bacterium]